MNPVHIKLQAVLFVLGFICLVFAAFRNGIGRNKTDFVALGLALCVFVIAWNAAAEAW